MRYYLHMQRGSTLIEDHEGEEFANLEAAREAAIWAAREIMADRLRSGRPFGAQTFEIHDEAGRRVATMPFMDAIPTE